MIHSAQTERKYRKHRKYGQTKRLPNVKSMLQIVKISHPLRWTLTGGALETAIKRDSVNESGAVRNFCHLDGSVATDQLLGITDTVTVDIVGERNPGKSIDRGGNIAAVGPYRLGKI